MGLGSLVIFLLFGILGFLYFHYETPPLASVYGHPICVKFRSPTLYLENSGWPIRHLAGISLFPRYQVATQAGHDHVPVLIDRLALNSNWNPVGRTLESRKFLSLVAEDGWLPNGMAIVFGDSHNSLQDFVLKFCKFAGQPTTDYNLSGLERNLVSAGQLTGLDLQQSQLPETEVIKTSEADSAKEHQREQSFLGTIIVKGGANVRTGPGLEYPVDHTLAFGRQLIFTGGGVDEEWLELKQGNWISASVTLAQPIFHAIEDSLESLPIVPKPNLSNAGPLAKQVAVEQQWKQVIVGNIITEEGANVREGPGLEFISVSAVPYGNLVGWVALSIDGEWLYLQHGHWISAALVSNVATYQFTPPVVEDEPVETVSPQEKPIAEIAPVDVVQGQTYVLLATVSAETGAELRSGPGFEYPIVDTASYGERFPYVAQSQDHEWLLLAGGDWVLASQVSTRKSLESLPPAAEAEIKFPDTDAGITPAEELESRAQAPLAGERSELAAQMKALRLQAANYINQARVLQGLSPLIVGDNQAAQNHADELTEQRHISSWNTAGWGPKMRYVQAGGESSNYSTAAYYGWFVHTECLDIQAEQLLEELLDSFMGDSDYRAEFLRPERTALHLGISYECSKLALVFILEGEYVSFEPPPSIKEGQLSMRGRLHNGAILLPPRDSFEGLRIQFRRLPQPLTRGQLIRVSGYCKGTPIAIITTSSSFLSIFRIFPVKEWAWASLMWTIDSFDRAIRNERSWEVTKCFFPFDIPPASLPPATEDEALRLLDAELDRKNVTERIDVRVIEPTVWRTTSDTFDIQVDLSDLVSEFGPGVYFADLWGEVNNNRIYLSEYPIIVE